MDCPECSARLEGRGLTCHVCDWRMQYTLKNNGLGRPKKRERAQTKDLPTCPLCKGRGWLTNWCVACECCFGKGRISAMHLALYKGEREPPRERRCTKCRGTGHDKRNCKK